MFLALRLYFSNDDMITLIESLCQTKASVW